MSRSHTAALATLVPRRIICEDITYNDHPSAQTTMRVALVRRPILSRTLLAVAVIAGIVSAFVAASAGVVTHVAGVRLKITDPFRPAIVALIAAYGCALLMQAGKVKRVALIVVTAGAIALAASAFFKGVPSGYPNGDSAFIELYTLHATRGPWPLGPYSAYGFHHPGPLYFYLLAPLYLAAGQRLVSIDLTAGLINAASLAAILFALGRSGSRSLMVCSLAVLTAYLVQIAPMFVSAWNPHVLILPLAALFVLSAHLATGALWLVPLVVILGSFIVQTHVGLMPSVGVIVASAIGWVAIPILTGADDRARASLRRWLKIGAWAFAAAWLLPVAEQLINTPGNLTRIYAFFVAGSDSRPPAFEATSAWANMISGVLGGDVKMPIGRPAIVTLAPLSLALAGGQMVLLPIAAWRMRRRQPVVSFLCVQGFLVAAAALWSVTQISGSIADHAIFWISIVGVLNWATLAAAAADLVIDRLAIPWSGRRFEAAVRAGFILMVSAYSVVAVRDLRDRALHPDQKSRERKAAADAIAGDMDVNHVGRALISGGHLAWGEQAGVVLQLSKRNLPIAVKRDSVFMYGSPLETDGHEEVEYVVAFTDEPDSRPARADVHVLLQQRHITILKVPEPEVRGRAQ